MKNPNFLILDEPTNDLDILTLQALEEFLDDFPGCLLVVSHDRYFLDKLCDHLFVFEGGGRIKDFNGHYYEWREEQKRIDAIKTAAPKPVVEESPKKEKTKTKMGYMEKREWDALPGEIEALEARRDALNAVFESTEQDPQEVAKAAAEIQKGCRCVGRKRNALARIVRVRLRITKFKILDHQSEQSATHPQASWHHPRF